MPRLGTIPADIVALLQERQGAVAIQEIVDYLNKVRRFPVARHSVRSAIYQHLNDRGEKLFVRVKRGQYALQRQPD
jgi:hypothetical protein